MKKIITAAAIALSFNAAAAGDFKNADKAIDYRQSSFSMMYHNFAHLGAMMKGKKAWNDAEFAKRSANVAALSAMALEGFAAGTATGSKETAALPAIWSDKADFEAKMKNFETTSAKLAEVAATNPGKKGVAAAFQDVAKNCKACHKPYKAD
ncbi:cytochrome c [Paraferrimonas sp. SM1919]|uniref:c-type cytochrome n=1 Tax=Paraferrimonas sp. SM1919 TaxID=2662263 RepID=UPI0013D30367|nr:cytochrome c [Paraferrimonas sp. SM1919]